MRVSEIDQRTIKGPVPLRDLRPYTEQIAVQREALLDDLFEKDILLNPYVMFR
jgi:hypothetical protein